MAIMHLISCVSNFNPVIRNITIMHIFCSGVLEKKSPGVGHTMPISSTNNRPKGKYHFSATDL